MGINTLVKDGFIEKMHVETTILKIPETKGNFNHNPSVARDKTGQIWISLRSNTVQVGKNLGLINDHAPKHYTNYLYVGKFNEDTFETTELKEITPVDSEYFEWGIEDVRIFFRDGIMHGIGVLVDTTAGGKKKKVTQTEIIIDHEKGTYTLFKNHGQPFGHTEKNWGPPTEPSKHFDFAYSPFQIVKGDEVIGEDYDGFIHGGTQLLPYKDGWLTIAHIVTNIKGEKHYISQALFRNEFGITTEMSQTFHLDVGWREHLRESVEFISGAVWSKGKEGKELLITLGVKDVLCGVARIPVEKLKMEPLQDVVYYNIKFTEEPTRDQEPIESLISSGHVRI